MTTFDWEGVEKMILSRTEKDDDHIVVFDDKRKKKDRQLDLTINGKRHKIHHWLYISLNKLDPSVKLNMTKICNHKECINLEHWVDIKSDNAIYKIGSYYLLKNSIEKDTCRLWTGSVDVDGYGYASFNNKSSRAHIVSMLVKNKIMKIPDGQVVRHICKNRHCVAKEHLELGTHKENSLDKIRDETMQWGSKNSNSQIDEKKALEIYKSKSSELTQKERAQLFNITQYVIASIDCGKSWVHITGHKKSESKRIIKPINENISENVFLKAQKYIYSSINEIIDEETNETHWIWSKSISNNGYGRCRFEGNHLRAHVVSWIVFNKKPVPFGLQVLHKCIKRRNCVNPEHLYLGTHEENMVDKKKDGTAKVNNKITEEQATLIIMSKGNGTANERGKRFNVSESIVYSIDCGSSWKDLREKLNIPITNSNRKNLIPCPIMKITHPIIVINTDISETDENLTDTNLNIIEKENHADQIPAIISKIKLKLKSQIT